MALYVLATLVMAAIVIESFSAGHPWALTCYQCKACNLKCPLGYDVSMYVAAAATDNPDLYMSSTKLQLILEEAYLTDPDMIVEINDERMSAGEAYDRYEPERVVWVRKLRAKDAAKFDPLDGYCDSMCPVDLPITDAIRDLKEDGKFGDG